ncbi:protein wntless homolog isoform 2-T3 [Pangshura tecta]
MAGAVIENMSTKKPCIVGGILLISQVITFLVGGLMAPSATTAMHCISLKCINVQKPHHQTKWLITWGPSQCEKVQDLDEEMSRPIDIGDIVFAVHFPLPNREMSSLLQFMIVTMQLDIMFKMNNAISSSDNKA